MKARLVKAALLVAAAGGLAAGWMPTTANALTPPSNHVGYVTNCDGREEAFGRASDMALWHNWQTTPGGSWSGWHSLGGRLISTGLVATVNPTCRVEVIGVGGDGAMWHIYQTTAGGGPWSGWSSLGNRGWFSAGPYAAARYGGKLRIAGLYGGRAVCDEQTRPGLGPWTGWSYCSVPV